MKYYDLDSNVKRIRIIFVKLSGCTFKQLQSIFQSIYYLQLSLHQNYNNLPKIQFFFQKKPIKFTRTT